MSINARIIAAVKPIVPVCVPDIYRPAVGEAASSWCTFNMTEVPEAFGNNRPRAIRYLVQLHYHAPWDNGSESNNTISIRKNLRRAVVAAGFTYPTLTDASDVDGQHFVFEFEGLDGEV